MEYDNVLEHEAAEFGLKFSFKFIILYIYIYIYTCVCVCVCVCVCGNNKEKIIIKCKLYKNRRYTKYARNISRISF